MERSSSTSETGSKKDRMSIDVLLHAATLRGCFVFFIAAGNSGTFSSSQRIQTSISW